ncbi:hypothetical protein PMEGAS228_48430 [Priestia megaterium]
MRNKVEVIYHSFQLDSNEKNRDISVEHLAQKKVLSVEQMKAKQVQVTNMIKIKRTTIVVVLLFLGSICVIYTSN